MTYLVIVIVAPMPVVTIVVGLLMTLDVSNLFVLSSKLSHLDLWPIVVVSDGAQKQGCR
jgi:hypothetical protein